MPVNWKIIPKECPDDHRRRVQEKIRIRKHALGPRPAGLQPDRNRHQPSDREMQSPGRRLRDRRQLHMAGPARL